MQGNLFVNNGEEWNPAYCLGRFSWEADDGSSYYHVDANVMVYGGSFSWLGHNLSYHQNLIIRPDFEADQDTSSPTCIASMFVSTFPSPNMSWTNNTCMTASGDLYSYAQAFPHTTKHTLNISQLNGIFETRMEKKRRHKEARMLPKRFRYGVAISARNPTPSPTSDTPNPPFIHDCNPSALNATAWYTNGNHFYSHNATGVSINCGRMSLSLEEWQDGFHRDVDSRDEGNMPNSSCIKAMMWDKLQLSH